MWSRGFGPSTIPLREVKSELLLQIERDLLRLVERSSSRLTFTTPAGTFRERV
jgi:hypothetical protein